MPSPARDPIPSLASSLHHTDLQPPPSPRTHRALRRLQSAHTLGASNKNGSTSSSPNHPSLISQQRQREQQQQRNGSPTRGRGVPQRARANSDATPPLVHQMNALTATKRSGNRKPVFSHGHLSLGQIIRDGPADGDYLGALESARWKVVDEGVKSAEDGMVGLCRYAPFRQTSDISLVDRQDIRMADPPRRPHPLHRRLPRPHPPRRISCLLQDP